VVNQIYKGAESALFQVLGSGELLVEENSFSMIGYMATPDQGIPLPVDTLNLTQQT
jgi:hypothetical protein